MISEYKRYQKGLKVQDLFPQKGDVCACGCGVKLTGRQKRWASESCSQNAYFNCAIIKGSSSIIRKVLYSEQGGYCQNCGTYDTKWQADHKLPVAFGGGGCDLTNFQTLCEDCHKKKTFHQIAVQRRAISSQEALNASSFR